ncbi:hypothetical protein D3C87_1809590 [compost metagenome]
MGCIGTNQPWLAWWRLGQQVAADVARGQSPGAYTGEHQVGKILADPASAFQHFHQRRRHLSRFGIEGKLAEDFLHQSLNAEQQRPPRREAALGKFDEVAL